MDNIAHITCLQDERRPFAIGYSHHKDTSCEHTPKLYYTAKEVAEMLSISPKTVYSLIYQGEWDVIRIGSSVRISKQSFEEWLLRLTAKE